MLKNLTKGGGALLALLALSAVLAGPASAKFDSEVESTYLHGTNTTNYVFTTSFGNITCKKTTTSGTVTGKKVAEGIYTSATTKATPTYSECTAFGFAATINTNGCEYEVLEPTEFKSSTKIICPAGKAITVTAAGFCTLTVGAQSPGGTLSITNEGAGSTRTMKGTDALTNITYGGSCGSGANATYSGSGVAKGFTSSAMTTQVGIWATK